MIHSFQILNDSGYQISLGRLFQNIQFFPEGHHILKKKVGEGQDQPSYCSKILEITFLVIFSYPALHSNVQFCIQLTIPSLNEHIAPSTGE